MHLKLGSYRVGSVWKSQQDVFKFLVNHFRRYHQMQIQDVYKLFYQGILGPIKYAALSPGDVEKDLFQEFERVDEDKNQVLWQSAHPEGKIVRVNLNAYKAHQGSIGTLSTLCLWTAEIYRSVEPNAERLNDALDTFYKLCKSRKIPKYDPLDVEKYKAWVIANHYPLVDHSEVYIEKYQPHYRLIHREFLSILTQ